uniref:Transport membrane protein n=1 Tax=Silene conica TaxID=39875 RepID=G8E8W8_SILCO|nr:transport membrane protein [Silene conica]
METFLGEARIRFVRVCLVFGLTWFTRYWFSQELVFSLTLPLLSLPLESRFLCTQLTEALSTYIATSTIACFYFVFPFVIYQIWCFLIPSSFGEERRGFQRLINLSLFCFLCLLFVTLYWIIPNVWHFSYFVSSTSPNALIIILQPRIYDYTLLIIRILVICSLYSQIPVIAIWFLGLKRLYVETFTNNRRFLLGFPIITASLFTPPDFWCQILVRFLLYLVAELAIFAASVLKVREREDSWTGGMKSILVDK